MRFPDDIPVYGDKSYRNKNCPKEQLEQITFVRRMREQHPDTLGALLVHVKNEGKRSHGQAFYASVEGLTKGASDIIIPCSPAIVIEFKRRDHTLCAWTDGQIEYLEAAQKMGSFVCVALGADAAMEAVNEWIRRHG